MEKNTSIYQKNDGGFLSFLTGVVAGASVALYLTTPEGKKTMKLLKARLGELLEEVEKKIEEEKELIAQHLLQEHVPPPHIAQIQSRGRSHLHRFFNRN